LFLCSITAAALADLKVAGTLEDWASLAREIGGGHITAFSLTKGTQDPHVVGAKPSLMRQLKDADVLLASGLELEVGWLPLVTKGSRNPRIQPGTKGYVECSQFVEVLEKPTGPVDRSQGDVHPEGNPHFNADPEAVARVALGVAEIFAGLDPDNALLYRRNAKVLAGKIRSRISGWKKRLACVKPVAAYHNNVVYFVHRFDLKNLGYIETRPGIAPTARHLETLIETLKNGKAKAVLYQAYTDPALALKVAHRAGVKAVLLPTEVGGLPEATDLVSKFEVGVAAVEAACR
jgi:zinc/manganese transport system substrate-binding protein